MAFQHLVVSYQIVKRTTQYVSFIHELKIVLKLQAGIVINCPSKAGIMLDRCFVLYIKYVSMM